MARKRKIGGKDAHTTQRGWPQAECAAVAGPGDVASYPDDLGIEVAFMGRSNSGKSSAINALTGVPLLSRTGKLPGRTRTLNFFTLDPLAQHRIVDLPGYGYANVPDEVKAQWLTSMHEYAWHRRSLKAMALVMDIRRPLQEADLEIVDFAQGEEMPLLILLTKADKVSRKVAQDTVRWVWTAVNGGNPHQGQGLKPVAMSATKGVVGEARALLRSLFVSSSLPPK